MSSVTPRASTVTAGTLAGSTPPLQPKTLPEAISLTISPSKMLNMEVSSAEDTDARSCASQISPFPVYRVSSEEYTASHGTGSRQQSSSCNFKAAIAAASVHEMMLTYTARGDMNGAHTVDHVPAVEDTQKPGESLAERRCTPTSPVSQKVHTATTRLPGDSSQANPEYAAFPISKPPCKDFAQPSPNLFYLRTRGSSPQECRIVLSEPSSATQLNRQGTAEVFGKGDHKDMSSVARSNTHLSVLADLLEKNVFSEEDVLLELEAIRKRSLLTTAPFNKRILPILAWYLLRDKFGEKTATKYVAVLRSAANTPRSDQTGNTTSTIPSFLPRVNEIRRVRREAKERNRKNPQHHYTITPPASPTRAMTASDCSPVHRQGRRRRTPAFDKLLDVSDLPTASVTRHSSPPSHKGHGRRSFSSSASPLLYGRLHVYTREHAILDRRRARAEDRPVVDVVLDATSREARANNIFCVVEAESFSVAEEPSVFDGPSQNNAAGDADPGNSIWETRIPMPPVSAHTTGSLEKATAYRRHGFQAHESQCCELFHLTPSSASLSVVSSAVGSVEALRIPPREDGAAAAAAAAAEDDQDCVPSVPVSSRTTPPNDASAADKAQWRRNVRAQRTEHRHVDRSPGLMDVSSAVIPCLSNILGVADGRARAPSCRLDEERVTSPVNSTVVESTGNFYVSHEHTWDAPSNHVGHSNDAAVFCSEDETSEARPTTLLCTGLKSPRDPQGTDDKPARVTAAVPCAAPPSAPLGDKTAAVKSTLCGRETKDVLENPREPRSYSYGRVVENSLSDTRVAAEYYSTLPDASMATQKPACSQQSRSYDLCEGSSARIPSNLQTVHSMGLIEKLCSTGSPLQSCIGTVALITADDATTTDGTGNSVHPIGKRSASIRGQVCAVESSGDGGVRSTHTGRNKSRCCDRALPVSNASKIFEPLSPTTTGATKFKRGGQASSTPKPGMLGSVAPCTRGAGTKTSVGALPAAENPPHPTPVNNTSDCFTSPSGCSHITDIRAMSHAPSAVTETLNPGSLILTNIEASTIGGGGSHQPSPFEPPHFTGPSVPFGDKLGAPPPDVISHVHEGPASLHKNLEIPVQYSPDHRGVYSASGKSFEEPIVSQDGTRSISTPRHRACALRGAQHHCTSLPGASLGVCGAEVRQRAAESDRPDTLRVDDRCTHSKKSSTSHPFQNVDSPSQESGPSCGGYGSVMRPSHLLGCSRSVELVTGKRQAKDSEEGAAGEVKPVIGESAHPEEMCAAEKCESSAPETVPTEDGTSLAESHRLHEMAVSGPGAVKASALIIEGCCSSPRPHHQLHAGVAESRLTNCTSEDTTTLDFLSACGEVASSCMDPNELREALQRLADNQVSCLKDNIACTFGDPGCRCATEMRHQRPKVVTKQRARRALPVRPSDAEGRARGFDRTTLKANPIQKASVRESQNIACPASATPLEKMGDIATRPMGQECKDHLPSAEVPLRSKEAVVRLGTGLHRITSQPRVGGSEKTFTQQPSQLGGNKVPPNTVMAAPTEFKPPCQCKSSSSSSHATYPAAPLVEKERSMNRVTALTVSCEGGDLSSHNLPDDVSLRGDINSREGCADAPSGSEGGGGPHRISSSMMAPASILRRSAGNYSTNHTTTRGDRTRPQIVAAVSEVSVLDGLTASGEAMAGSSPVTGPPRPAPRLCDAAVVTTTDEGLGNESLRAPQNVTMKLFGGPTQPARFSTVEEPQEHSADGEDTANVHEATPCCDVQAKRANLTTLLGHSRLEVSHVGSNFPSMPVASAAGRGSRWTEPYHSRGVAVDCGGNTETGATVVVETRIDSTNSTSEVAQVDCSDVKVQRDSMKGFTLDKSSELMACAPRRGFGQRPPLSRQNRLCVEHESRVQREERQRHRTLLDVSGVPYVDSPNASTCSDMNERRRKEKQHAMFLARWARRGLLWKRQETEAQRYEKAHGGFGA